MKTGSISQHFVDFITLKYDVETSRTIAEEIKDSGSLLSEGVVSEHVSTQPFLLTFLLFGFLLSIGFLSSTITLLTCRFYGKCGARRYQSHPTSARSFTVHLTIFLVSWVIMASSSISFIYSGVTYWNSEYYQDSVLISNYSLQDDFYRLYRSKRESSVLAALFNDDDYNGNFEELPASEKPIIFETTFSPKINGPLPIGKDLQMGEINEKNEETAFKIDDSTITTTLRSNKTMRDPEVKNRSTTSTNQINLPYTIESKANDMLNIRPIHYEKPRKQITIPLRPKAELEYMQYDASEEEKMESEETRTTRQPLTSPYSIPISFLRKTGMNRGIAPITPRITTTTPSTTISYEKVMRRITSTTPPNVNDEEYEYSEEQQLQTNKRIASLNNRVITTSKPIPFGLFGRKDDYDEKQIITQPLNGKIKAELWKEQKKIQTISPIRTKSVEQWLPPILDNRVDVDRSDVVDEKEEIEYEDEEENEANQEKTEETTMRNEVTRVIFKRVDLPPNTLAQVPGGRPLLAKEVMTISPKTSSYLSPSAPFITTTTTEPPPTTRIPSMPTTQTRISTSYPTTRKPITTSSSSTISTTTPLTLTTTTTTMTTTMTTTTTSTTTTLNLSTPAAIYYSSTMEGNQGKNRESFNLQKNWQQGHSVDLTNWSKESGDGNKRKSHPNFDRKEKTLETSFESLETPEPNLIVAEEEKEKETESTTRTTRKLFVGSTRREIGKEINPSTRKDNKIEISTRRSDFGDLISETEQTTKGLSMIFMTSTRSTSKAIVETEPQTTESSTKLSTSNPPKLSKSDRLTHSSQSTHQMIVFYSLHSNFIFWFHRFSFLPIAFFMIFTVIPAIAAVISGVVCYANSYHPMDRNTRSHRIGLVTLFLSTSLICSTSLLILYSCFSLFYAHIHSIVCPIAQLKLNNLSFDTSAHNLMAAFEDKCSEFSEPIQILWSSSLFFGFSSLIVSITMFSLSKYFLRMKTEHYWQQNDVYGMIRRKAAENIYGEAIYGGFYGRNVDPIYAPPIRPKTRPPPPPPENIYGFIGMDNIYGVVPQQENIYGTIPAQPPQYAQGRYDQYGEIYGARHLGGKKISQTQQQATQQKNNNNNNDERLGDYGTYQKNHDKNEFTYF